jgi:Skp family chaperone for outer membrane proteins
MNHRIASAVIGSLLLAGGSAVVAQSTAAQSIAPGIQIAAGEEPSDKSSYVDKAKAEMAEWRTKLDRFSEDTKTKGHELSAKAKTELDEAWQKTEDAGHKLQGASADGWDNAKSAYQRAKQSLENTWDRVRQSGE